MKLCLFNLTDNTILFKSEWGNDSELLVLPEASAAIPLGKQKFVISSVGGSRANTPEKVFLDYEEELQYVISSVGGSRANTPEKVFLDYEEERQYVVNLSKSSSSRRSLLTMPEDCPWRIYRDQVTSPTLLYKYSVE